MKLKSRISILALSLFALFVVATPTKSVANNGLIFEACWAGYGGCPGKAVFRDANWNAYICGDCDSSGSPVGGRCYKANVSYGAWCS